MDNLGSMHPRTRKCAEAAQIRLHPLMQFHKPFGFLDYIELQFEAHAVVSDSGTITEESSILNFPAINLRDVHERPEGSEEAAVMFTGLDPDRLLEAISILATQGRRAERTLRMVYTTINVSDKVLRIVMSYTEFVNQRVWRKHQ